MLTFVLDAKTNHTPNCFSFLFRSIFSFCGILTLRNYNFNQSHVLCVYYYFSSALLDVPLCVCVCDLNLHKYLGVQLLAC